MSPTRAKSRTRIRKRHLNGTKARAGGAQKTRADLEQQLKACRRKLAHARERLAEAMKQKTATSEVMRIISSSPIQSVLDAVAENAARLCEANNAEIFRLENNLLHLVASYGEIPVNIQAREGLPANRERVIGRAACDRRTIQVRNLAAEENEFPAGSSDAKREGHRTTLATPLLREGAPIGAILSGDGKSDRSPPSRSRFSRTSPTRRRSRSKTRACSKPRSNVRWRLRRPTAISRNAKRRFGAW